MGFTDFLKENDVTCFQIDLEPDAYKIWWQGVIYRTQNRTDKMIECFAHAARMGESYAQYELARAYENSEGIRQDRRKALSWYSKAAGQGDIFAGKHLEELREQSGNLLADGIPEVMTAEEIYEYGLVHFASGSYNEARVCLEEAAILGHPAAKFNLERMLPEGTESLSPDLEEHGWTNTQNGPEEDLDAIWIKGTSFYLLKKIWKAVECYAYAAQQGNAYCQYDVACAYKNGTGLLPDKDETYGQGMGHIRKEEYEKAFVYLFESAIFGHMDAQFHLGRMYDEGKGVNQNKGEAVHWKRAACFYAIENLFFYKYFYDFRNIHRVIIFVRIPFFIVFFCNEVFRRHMIFVKLFADKDHFSFVECAGAVDKIRGQAGFLRLIAVTSGLGAADIQCLFVFRTVE